MAGKKKADEIDEAEQAQAVADELARRSAGQSNGGGPFPRDLLLERYVGARRAQRS